MVLGVPMGTLLLLGLASVDPGICFIGIAFVAPSYLGSIYFIVIPFKPLGYTCV